MKSLLSVTVVTLVSAFFLGCEPSEDTPTSTGSDCTYNGHTLHVGPKGGCYYINSNGNQTYVDRSYCAGCD